MAGLLSAAVLLQFAIQGDAFWRMPCHGTSGFGRMDPIVEPGEVSAHVHSIHSGSNFNFNATAAELLASDCTACQVKQDKSAYWSPALYFKHDNGDFEMVDQKGGLLVYYRLDKDLADLSKPVTAFPNDFHMIAGNNFKRGWSGSIDDQTTPQSLWAGWETTQPFLEQMALGFNCLNYAGIDEPFLGRHELPERSLIDGQCTDGLRFEIVFPSCWNGRDLDVPGHKAHMAYPTNIQAGNCPETHPVKVPTLFFETIYDTYKFKGQAGEFVIANGDATGYGYHGDFLAAWEPGVLQQAVDTCTNDDGMLESCPVFQLNDEETMVGCKFPVPDELKDEDVFGPRPGLPGDVQVTYGPEPATPDKAAPPVQIGVSSVIDGAAPPTTTAAPPTPTVVPSPPAAPTSVKSQVQAVVPEITPVASPPPPEVQYATTAWSTSGNVVFEVLIEHETVWVDPPAPTPLLARRGAADARSHLQQHKRHVHHHGHAH